jgi:hypothetical protein
VVIAAFINVHYYILCLFAKGQTKNLKGLRSKNNLPYLRCDTHRTLWCTNHRKLIMYIKSSRHFCDIYHKQNFATRSCSVHPSDIPHFATFNHTQNIAHFTIQKVSLKTLRVTTNRKLALFGASHFVFEYVSQTSSQIFTKLSGGGRIASYDVRQLAN